MTSIIYTMPDHESETVELKNNNQIEYIGPAKGGYWKAK